MPRKGSSWRGQPRPCHCLQQRMNYLYIYLIDTGWMHTFKRHNALAAVTLRLASSQAYVRSSTWARRQLIPFQLHRTLYPHRFPPTVYTLLPCSAERDKLQLYLCYLHAGVYTCRLSPVVCHVVPGTIAHTQQSVDVLTSPHISTLYNRTLRLGVTAIPPGDHGSTACTQTRFIAKYG